MLGAGSPCWEHAAPSAQPTLPLTPPPHPPRAAATPPLQVPKLPLPFEEGWKLQDGLPVGKQLYDTLVLQMMNVMNAGIDVIKGAEGSGGGGGAGATR